MINYVYWLAVLLIVLNIIDLVQTHMLLRINGVDGEANVLARYIYSKSGNKFMSIVLLKVILIGFAISIALLIDSLLVLVILDVSYIFAIIYNWRVIKVEIEIAKEEGDYDF